jgi:hypothetical protein
MSWHKILSFQKTAPQPAPTLSDLGRSTDPRNQGEAQVPKCPKFGPRAHARARGIGTPNVAKGRHDNRDRNILSFPFLVRQLGTWASAITKGVPLPQLSFSEI